MALPLCSEFEVLKKHLESLQREMVPQSEHNSLQSEHYALKAEIHRVSFIICYMYVPFSPTIIAKTTLRAFMLKNDPE
jgi:hypothetical protein